MTDSARPFEGLTLAVTAPSRQWVTNEGGIVMVKVVVNLINKDNQ